MLGLMVAFLLWRTIAVIGLPFSVDPNEGWNAYFAAKAASAGALYPAPGGDVVNNYPPLSFSLIGLLAGPTGDAIIVGRIVSLASWLCVSLGLAGTARALGATRRASLLAAALFGGGLLAFTDYVGMNDPQLLAHVFATGGLLIVLASGRGVAALTVAAALFALAFFVKHNVMAMAAASVLWLALFDRRAAVRLIGAGLIFAAVGLALFRLTYGMNLWTVVASPRTYALTLFGQGVGNWLLWNGLPFCTFIALAVGVRRNRPTVFVLIYGGVAIVMGGYFLGGSGVDANALFDADLAMALAVALFVTRLRKPLLRGAAALAIALPIFCSVGGVIRDVYRDGDSLLRPGTYAAETSRADIAFLRARPGPALCALPSFCYWAGKPFAVDVFNDGEAFATGAKSDADLVRRLRAHAFSALQFDPEATDALGKNVERAVRETYRLDHRDDFGLFYVPKR